MTIIGYARASTEDQDCTIQEHALANAGCAIVRSETKSGTTTIGREGLQTILEFLQEGDTLMVTRIDRLARSVKDLEDIVATIEAKGAHLRATEQPIDTSSPAGKAFLQMLGVFAEFETSIRRERQMEGIARAKARGVYRGRKPSVDPGEVRRLAKEGLRSSEIAKRLGVSRSTVWRVLRDAALPSDH